MALSRIPASTTLQDEQFISIEGPDKLITSYQYDAAQQALYFKESQVIFPSFHGATHIAEDPVPSATCDTPGLLSADDKCKLDALLQTRMGVLGFMGAGFPDDGGWLQGDIILAAGTEFISLERIGNVVRFTVDSPIPMNCACEECTQIFWVQDETDVHAIRPPVCSGKLPGTNHYGEMKIYLLPESTIIDPTNPALALANKGNYPSLVFKRYDDSIAPGTAEYELVLKRDSVNLAQTEIGWAFTPGAAGVSECVYFMGKDNDGNQMDFQLSPNVEPGLLGSLLYKGHLLTKAMAVVVDYTTTILSTNQYTCKMWDVDNHKTIGSEFVATNVWQYKFAENATTGANPQTQILDSTIDLLPAGTLVDIWFFKIGEVAGSPINRYYFNKKPNLNPQNLWSWTGGVQFGDSVVARDEVQAGPGSDDKTSSVLQSAIRNFESSQWGLTGLDDPLLDFSVAITAGTEEAEINREHRAIIDTTIPALKVVADSNNYDDFSERPVMLWYRKELENAMISMDIGRPNSSDFTPIDIILRGNIDEHVNKYMKVVRTGTVNGLFYVQVKGVQFHDLPQFGAIRVLQPLTNHNVIFNYSRKMLNVTGSDFGAEVTGGGTDDLFDSVILVGDHVDSYLGAAGDLVELLHQDYNNPIVRLEFGYSPATGLVELQFKIGTLDMGLGYEEDLADDLDDFVRGLSPGYAVSAVYSQAGTYTGVGTQPVASPTNFVVFDGGAQIGGNQDEYWNNLEIMLRDNQVWIWWNQLLVPPSTSLSAGLTTPVNIDTPYFSIATDDNKPYGKIGARMWPGAMVRRISVKSQLHNFSEFAYGQLQITPIT
jgi:hypothetical protein